MKATRIGWLAGLLLALLPGPLDAAGDSDGAAAFVSAIQEAAAEVQSFSAGFVQEKRLALFEEPVFFEGTLTVVRPDRLRWEFHRPIPSALVLDGESGLRCSDGGPDRSFSLAEDPLMGVVAEQLWLWLGGDYQRLLERYQVRVEGGDTLVATPGEPEASEYLDSVRIVFDRDDLQPRLVVIAEPGGNQTLISFEEPVVNPAIPDELFTTCRDD